MDKVSVTLEVFFEDPFWVGIVERVTDGMLDAAKVTFGPEPKKWQVWDFFLKNYGKLRFSPAVAACVKEKSANPKRKQREAKKQLEHAGMGTRSQQALKLQQEQSKTERRVRSRLQREEEQQRRFELRQQKKREKHRGR